PRSLKQYELFRKFWPDTRRGDYQIVFIELPAEDAVGRLTRRVTCENCDAIFREPALEKCPNCGDRLLRRPDDTPAAIQNRMQSFYNETMPMILAMEEDGKMLHIDNAASIDEVQRKIIEALQQ